MRKLLAKNPNKNNFQGFCALIQVFPLLILVSPVARP